MNPYSITTSAVILDLPATLPQRICLSILDIKLHIYTTSIFADPPFQTHDPTQPTEGKNFQWHSDLPVNPTRGKRRSVKLLIPCTETRSYCSRCTNRLVCCRWQTQDDSGERMSRGRQKQQSQRPHQNHQDWVVMNLRPFDCHHLSLQHPSHLFQAQCHCRDQRRRFFGKIRV